MLASTSPAFAKTKTPAFLLFLLCCICCTKHTYAQKAPSNPYFITRFAGTENSGTPATTTWRRVLAEPELIVMPRPPGSPATGMVVTKFAIGFKPKGMEFQGPYPIKGSKLDKHVTTLIEENLAGNHHCTIFIDDIHVRAEGTERILPNPFEIKVSE